MPLGSEAISFDTSVRRLRRRPSLPILALVIGGLALVGCTTEKGLEEYVERPVDRLYNEGLANLQGDDYENAVTSFEEVERQHPYSVWATKAQIMGAYANYQQNNYDDAITALDRFIQLHPTNKDIPYAYYLKGLSYYEQISDVSRDQKMTELALDALNEVATRFPDSKYARDAKYKMDLTLDHLAGKEMEIGRYYHNQRQYLAAINRFRSVLERYQTTTHVPEALHRLTEAYIALGLQDQARKTAAVLGHNFPGSEWYVDSYEMMTEKKVRPENEEQSWLDSLKFW